MTSCVLGVGVGTNPYSSRDAYAAACGDRAKLANSLCSSDWSFQRFVVSAVADAAINNATLAASTAVQAVLRTIFTATQTGASVAANCEQAIPGLKSTSTGTVVSSVCPAMNGWQCVTPDVAEVEVPAGVRYYKVRTSVQEMDVGYTVDSSLTCPSL